MTLAMQASLPAADSERLFEVQKNLRDRGCGMIYVSHRLDEVFAISDSVTVFRDGRLIHAGGIKDKTPQDLIIDIVGSKPKSYQSRFNAQSRPVVLSGERVLAGPAGPVSFQVHAGEVDVLVGTQMVTKGHDFRRITLVVAVNPDSALFASDFRAPERLFALLMQAAGRAGRDTSLGTPSDVWVQTYEPGHHLYVSLRAHDYPAFADTQLRERRVEPVLHGGEVRRHRAEVRLGLHAVLRGAPPSPALVRSSLMAARRRGYHAPRAAAATYPVASARAPSGQHQIFKSLVAK